MDSITTSHQERISHETLVIKNINNLGRNEEVRSMLKAFLHKHKTHTKTPEEIRKMLDKKIPKNESLSEDIINMRR